MSNFALPYIVGNTLNRDHINHPTVTPAQLAAIPAVVGQTFPPQITATDLDTILAMSWRIRLWRITGSFQVAFSTVTETAVATSSGGPENDPPWPVRWENVNDASLATKEIDLIGLGRESTALADNEKFTYLTGGPLGTLSPQYGFVLHGFDGLQGVPFTVVNVTSTPPGSNVNKPLFFDVRLFDVRPAFTLRRGGEFVAFDADIFYPGLSCHGVFDVSSATHDGYNRCGFEIGAGGSGTLTIDPVITPAITVPLRVGGVLPNALFEPITDLGGSASFTMTATEFWPYRNSLDEPVFDSATGEEINDPFA